MANEYTGTGSGTSQDGSTGKATDGIKGKAQEVLSNVRERASEKIEGRVSEQKTRAAESLSGVAQSLLTSSEQMRSDGQEDVGRYIEKAADQVDRLAHYIENANVQEVFQRVETFARRQPAAFVAGAFAVGFLASRFLKSSRGDDYGNGGGGYGTGGFGSGESEGYEAGSNFNTSGQARGSYSSSRDYSSPRTETWRDSGYSASESNTRDIIGDETNRGV